MRAPAGRGGTQGLEIEVWIGLVTLVVSAVIIREIVKLGARA